MPIILVVCTANICRSPVAEALLRQRLHQRGLTDWQVRSAGTWAQMKRGASRYSIQVAAVRGLDLQDHVAEMIAAPQLQAADLVLCMEAGHVESLKAEFPAYADKIYLLSEMIGRRYSVKDPYGGPLRAYEMMANELAEIIDNGLDRIIDLAQAQAATRAP